MQLCVENKLAGIVSHVDPLIEDFKVVSSFQSRGFKVMTFGGGNTVDRIIKKQKDAGVNGIITDDIPLTKKILET